VSILAPRKHMHKRALLTLSVNPTRICLGGAVTWNDMPQNNFWGSRLPKPFLTALGTKFAPTNGGCSVA
jgi:hypothetical protein